jgi:hypothetical protein
MGRSLDAILAYGYDLGGSESGWLFNKLEEEYTSPKLDWFDFDKDSDFIAACEKRLFASVGFDDSSYSIPGYGERRKVAETRLGVEFVYYGYEYGGSILSASKTNTYYGVKLLDLASLVADALVGDWDEKLANACRVLGVTPNQEKPGWLLAPVYG